MFSIEKNIPAPAPKEKAKGRYPIYPFVEMEVGDSFSFPEESFQSVYYAARYYGKQNSKKFVVKSRNLRVWRVE